MAAFEEHAQNGHGLEHPADRDSLFLPFLAVRSRALCAYKGV
jgi:hypothetical protein